MGAFDLEEFLDAIRTAGLSTTVERRELSDWGGAPELPLITAIRLG